MADKKLLNLSQVSRSGKSTQSNTSLDANYAENDVMKVLTFNDIAYGKGFGGIIINASLFRARNDANASDFPTIQIDLYEEEDVTGITEGDEYELGGGFNPIIHLPFASLIFNNDNSQVCARYTSDVVVYKSVPTSIVPASFQCEETSKSIYGVLVCRESGGFDLSSQSEKWAVQLSVSY